MDTHHITNETLWTTDFARAEKAKFLKSHSRKKQTKRSKTNYVAPGVPAQSVWMTDVSGSDRRSVKAQLAGRGDYRVAWWEFNCLLHRLFNPRATLEQIMYAFHSRHHALTFKRLEAINDYRILYQEMRQHGNIAGLGSAFRQMYALRKHK
jgi:hypothetical protein